MDAENTWDDLEGRAEQLLEDVLALDDAEIDSIYRTVLPGRDPRERVRELADRAATLCEDVQKPQTEQLHAALRDLAQLEFPLEMDPLPARPCILLVDDDANRLSARMKLFRERRIETEVTTSVADGLALLEIKKFQLVIVDYCAITREEQTLLRLLQQFNLQVPVINVCAWANLMHSDDRHLNHELLRAAARIIGSDVPKRLPARRPPEGAQPPQEEALFNAG
jgi:CheY-like chemotaxis protein